MSHTLTGAFILAELDGAVWQNRVTVFRVVPYLARKEISYNKEVKQLLDAPEESICRLKEKMNTSDLDEPPNVEEITET